jgi:hypothetical protein
MLVQAGRSGNLQLIKRVPCTTHYDKVHAVPEKDDE